MKKILILLSFCCFHGCETKQQQPENIQIQKEEPVNQTLQILLDLHNKERSKKGHKSLILDENLCKYAQNHAEYMAQKNKLVHASMSKLMEVNNDSLVAENIAWGQETEEQVMKTWMNSYGHKSNILGSKYKKIGIGIKKDKNNRNYWCVVFSN